MKTTIIILINIMLVFSLQAITKTSIANGNWSSPNVWSPSGVPASGDKIKIYHNVLLDVNFSVSDTIFVYKNFNMASSKSLTLNPGTLILVNDSIYDGKIGSMGSGARIIGNYTFQKWIDRCDGYSLYGSPFTTLISNFDWYYCYQCMPSWSNVYMYDETATGALDNGYIDNIGQNFTRGKGFFYWFKNYAGGKNFARKITLRGSTDFAATFDFGITRTVSGGVMNDGFNLLSNPFPGTLDWLSGAWSRENMVNAVYTWNTCTDSYASYAAGVGVNGGSRYIPSMQGFWVQATASAPKLRVGSGALTNNSQAMLRSESSSDSVNYVLRLKLDNDEIAIRLDPNASSKLDSDDALKFYTESSKLSSFVSNDSLLYSINSLKDTNQVVSVKTKGSGTLNFKGLSSFFNQYSIYFKDVVTGNYKAVSEDLNYNFTDTSLVSFNKRFEIYFYKNSVTGIKNLLADQINIRYDAESIFIQLPPEFTTATKVTVYDLSGNEISSSLMNASEQSFPKNNMPVILKVTNQNGSLVKKIF